MSDFRLPNLNRKQFITLSLGSLAWALSGAILTANPPKNQAQILVIGAGIAGLAAARQLQQQGLSVKVLEGRSRIGGRIYTDRSLGLPVDLGAAWIHGINGNPIHQLANQFQLSLLSTDYDNRILYDFQGEEINRGQYQQVESIYQRLIQQAKDLGEELDRDISLAEAMRRVKNESLSPLQTKLLQWLLTSNIVTETGTDLESLSVLEWGEDKAFPGEDKLFPQGYDGIIQNLAQGLDIQLNQKVVEVEYNDRRVRVKTERESFQAEAVIVTLPLGVLKAKTVKFTPSLPLEKQQAIANLQMGVLNKVVLKFPHIFWDEEVDFLGYVSQQARDFSEFVNFAYYTEQPVLVALTGGAFARSLEDSPLSQIQAQVMETLTAIYGTDIPQPEEITVTKWGSDRFSLGAYSQVAIGGKNSDRQILAKSIDNRVFFAGEATSTQYATTVHGAYLSGLDAARQIAKFWDKS